MTTAAVRDPRARVLSLDPPTPPAWVLDLVGVEAPETLPAVTGGGVLRMASASGFRFLGATVPEAAGLDDRAFRLAVEETYLAIGECLRARQLFPLRFWNYLPGLQRGARSGMGRYEIFNVGRFRGYAAWHGTQDFGDRLAPACAVGHRGDDLVVHLLAGEIPGTPVENPRQTPAYRYSRRYGPLPPCFARATLLPFALRSGQPGRSAIVAGTASIVGEDTRSPGDLEGQLHETLVNLASLSDATTGRVRRTPLGASPASPTTSRALARYQELRVYLVRERDAGRVLHELRKWFPDLRNLELAAADLCRPELLIEIEGVLALDPRSPRGPARRLRRHRRDPA